MQVAEKEATIDTFTVTLERMTVNNRQMTKAVFNQMPISLAAKYPYECWWGYVLEEKKDEINKIINPGNIRFCNCYRSECTENENRCNWN